MNKLTDALNQAQAWISSAPHGDNCYVSEHYEGDPGDRCNCGKDSVESSIEAALAAPPAIAGEPVAEDWEDIPDSLIADLLRFAWKREPTLREITAAAKAARPNKEQA